MKINFEIRIVLIYLIVGSLWILFSDKAILFFINDAHLLTHVQTYKGWFYVFITGILLYFLLKRYISKIKASEKDLVIAKEKAEEFSELKSVFISNISHEIRTPMNGIMGFTELLYNQPVNEQKIKMFTSYILKNAKELMSIVDNLMNISRIDSNSVELVKSDFNVNEVLNEIYSVFKPIAVQKSINLLFEKEIGNTSSNIYSDKTKIQNILSNLLSNAIKFTETGYVKFGCLFEEQYIKFYVEDTGIGISKDAQSTIFEQFGQVEKGLTRRYRGTGIGLAICAKYVSLMEGQIWVNSDLGKGATFIFTIPYEKPKTIAKPPFEKISGKLKDWKNYTILIAEDEDTNFEYLKELLRRYNLNVIRANNGLEALQYFKTNNDITIILMDLKMPVMNGLDATREIKKIKPNIPVIAQTAFAMNSDKISAADAGCDHLIAKPIHSSELIALLEKYLV